MIVVCDTNVFVRETHLLRKKGGPQLVRLLQAIKGQLFVPEVLRTEYIEQTRAAASEERTKATAAITNFKTLIGGKGRYVLLGDDAVDQRTSDRLEALGPVVLSTPSSHEILAAAGQRSLQKKRPTSKSDHGYKDCLIWESVLRLPAGSKVCFVSRDSKAFFDADGFAKELVAEAAASGVSVVGYRELDHALRDLQANIPTLDLAAVEALDIVERQIAVDPDSALAVQAAVLTNTAAAPVVGLEAISLVAERVATEADKELAALLLRAQKPFENLDRKVLGYVAYFGGAEKTELFDLLSQSGISAGAAKNVAERLVIAGLIRDTGNHYLPIEPTAAELAAAAMEPEIIKLLGNAR